jgi:hypothetical protein
MMAKEAVTETPIAHAKATPIKTQTYTGKALKPAVKLAYGGAALKEGADYTLKYSGNVAPGKAEVTVAGRNGFGGVTTLYFRINPATQKITKLIPGKGKLTVVFKKPSATQKATSLMIRYRVKGAPKWKAVSVPVRKSSYVIKKVAKGKRYQVQMRVVRAIKSGAAKGSYKSAWSAPVTSKAVK